MGQKRRLLQMDAAPRLPLYTVSDQTRAAPEYVAKGHEETHAPQQSAGSFDHVVGAQQ
jgi:hypothetical protein